LQCASTRLGDHRYVHASQGSLETIQELRQKRPGSKIIAISGAPTGLVVLDMAKKLGAQAVLHKPFLSDEVISTLNKILQAA
jgi:ActR/RegA family two-component response regulator